MLMMCCADAGAPGAGNGYGGRAREAVRTPQGAVRPAGLQPHRPCGHLGHALLPGAGDSSPYASCMKLHVWNISLHAAERWQCQAECLHRLPMMLIR